MNHTRAYARMTGKLVDDPVVEEELEEKRKTNEILRQQKEAWLNLHETKVFLAHLDKEEIEYMKRARGCQNSNLITKFLTKSETIKEITDYARSSNSISN